jgi:hypothetical protein
MYQERTMSHNRNWNPRGGGRRAGGPPGQYAPWVQPNRAAPRHPGWRANEELFGRQPFTFGGEPRYFGTGVAGYTSGPGFTGGYYGYGDEPAELPTELEREYAQEVYGPGWESPGYGPGEYVAGEAGGALRPRHIYRYPPGPKGYQRSDERIREDICDRLMRAANHIDASEVTVEVTGGKVVLEGTVPARRMKHVIEDLADSCLGVKDIENRIRVQAPSREA